MAGSRVEQDVLVLELDLRSPRDADVLILHASRPVLSATIAATGQPPVTSIPTYGEAEVWPYELRFAGPPPAGIRVTLRLPGEKRRGSR